MRNNNPQDEKRRTLKKVRRNFLQKTPSEEQKTTVDIPEQVNTSSFNIIDPSLYVVEKNRKVYFGIHYVQSNYNISNIIFDNTFFSKNITINLQLKENKWPVEVGIKRLESYGDLGLATLGWKIRDHHLKYRTIMENYLSLVHSRETNIISNIQKARNRAALLAREIESKYIYKKVLIYMNKNSSKMLSISYSKEMVEHLGYNVDDFVDQIKGNGLPCL